MDTQMAATPDRQAGVVIWLDRSHALIARGPAGQPQIVEVDRSFDAESSYLLRVIHEAADSDRLVVMGTDAARVAFEREYVALYHRPDRLIDVGQVIHPRRAELVDQLRMLER
jgi:hypothetical protein